MQVADLIAKLQEFPPDMRVVILGYEYGVDDLLGVSEVSIKLNAHDPENYWAAPHRVVDRGDAFDEVALVIGPAER